MARHDKKARRSKLPATSAPAIDTTEVAAETHRGPQPPREPPSVRLLRKCGATESQIVLWNAAIERKSRIAAPSQASRICLKSCAQWCFEGANAMRDADPGTRLTFQRFDFGHDEDGERPQLDIRGAKARLLPQLKREFASSWAVIRPTVLGTRVGLSAFVLGLAANPESAVHRLRKVRSLSQQPPTSAVTIEIGNDEQLREIIARIWSPLALHQLLPGDEKPKVQREHAVAEFRCEIARLLLPIDRSMFGHGIGKKLATGMARTVKARAALIDIAGTAPLQPEGVASFLASLPADRTGKPAPLPVIRHL